MGGGKDGMSKRIRRGLRRKGGREEGKEERQRVKCKGRGLRGKEGR